jgi:hypothetical protein
MTNYSGFSYDKMFEIILQMLLATRLNRIIHFSAT